MIKSKSLNYSLNQLIKKKKQIHSGMQEVTVLINELMNHLHKPFEIQEQNTTIVSLVGSAST